MTEFVRRGRGEPPQPLESDSEIVSMKGCPDCHGRGWFLINPFKTGGGNGVGGVRNMTQCLTCLDARVYWDAHGSLPPGLTLETQHGSSPRDQAALSEPSTTN